MIEPPLAPAMIEAGTLALSTMYFQRFRGAESLAPFFEAGAAMGFRRFELSHILPAELVDALEAGDEEIVAVHHPCPARSADALGLSLFDEQAEKRRFAAARLEDSIRTADRLGAGRVVLHLGKLGGELGEICRRQEFELDARLRAEQEGLPRFEAAAEALRATLAAAEPRVLEIAVEALERPLRLAMDRGIRVGIETGYAATELPTAKGMRWLLDAFSSRGLGAAVGAWLDTGHIAARASIGLDDFAAWFEAVDGKWIGVHLHDCHRRRDHLAPGMGSVDFGSIARRLPHGIVETCEIDWYLGADEIREGRDRLIAAGFGRG